jgi:Nucleotide modification associated domain 1
MTQTQIQYTNVMTICREIFEKKTLDYGLSWRILRPSSLTDQLFIKAQRIRTIQETGKNLVGESFEDAFQAIVNYCIMAIIQVREPAGLQDDMQAHEAIERYKQISAEAEALMQRKNHDYGEAWRDMRVSSLTDLILSKIMRIKQIEDNAGATQVSEGVDYSVFALIHLENC